MNPIYDYNDHVVMYGLGPSVGAPDLALMGRPWDQPCMLSLRLPKLSMDAEDEAVLADEGTMLHIAAASDAHRRARRGERVDWEQVMQEHILE